jgi:hypothetical protein
MKIAAHEQQTERGMLGLLNEDLRLAAECCDRLGAGERGPLYPRLRELLLTAEDLVRKIAHNRGDTRWLTLVRIIEQLIDQVKRNMDRHAGKPLTTMPRGVGH